jgi:hypothetical protein
MVFDMIMEVNLELKKPEKNAILLLSVILSAAIFTLSNNTAYASTPNQNQYRLSYAGNTYVIQYSIENATLDNVEVNLQKQGLILQIGNATANGMLTFTLPRNLTDSKCGGEDLPFIIMMNDKEMITGRDPNASEVTTSSESRTVALTFPGQTRDIFIGVFSSPSLSTCNSLSLTPNEQRNGIRHGAQNSLQIGNITINKEQRRIIIPIGNTTIRDGFLKLELSRDAIDSKNNAGKDTLFVITYSNTAQTNAVAKYYEIASNDKARTLLVELPAGYKELIISGTQVVPEFPIVQLIVAISIASIVAMSFVSKRLL